MELQLSSLIFPSCDLKSTFLSLVFFLGEFLRTGISYKTLASLGRDTRRHYLKVSLQTVILRFEEEMKLYSACISVPRFLAVLILYILVM